MTVANASGGSQSRRARSRAIPFGKYLLLERVAVGGMAEVYIAKSFGVQGFEKMLAIKRILPTMAEDSDFIEMFIDEAKIAGQLNHANIVPIYELGKIGESHYIAMEYVWGKDLLQIMNRFRKLRKRMPGAMVALIAAKMCEALDYAHTKADRRGQPMEIIHRDVSPQNILVSYEGEVKVIDFGIAKAASRNTKTQAGVLKGKFGYMSPEQVRGKVIDRRSDLFAVGTCMYEMLTSDRLFMGESDFSTLERVRNADVRPLSQVLKDISPQLEGIVMKALSREPEDRHQSAAELQHELHDYLAQQRPPFGTSKLSTWLKSAFAEEIAEEKSKLDRLAAVGPPNSHDRKVAARAPSLKATAQERPSGRPPARSVPPPVPPPTAQVSAPADDEMEDEATMISASPFDELLKEQDELLEQPTEIFFSSNETPLGEESAPSTETRSARPGPGASAAADVESPVWVDGISESSPPSTTAPLSAAELASHNRKGASASPPSASVDGKVRGWQNTARTHAVSPPRDQKWFATVIATVVLLGALTAWLAVKLLGGPATGVIEIRTVPSVGAEIWVDGVPRGRAPLRIEGIAEGERHIEVEAEGFARAERHVHVTGDISAMLEIALQRTSEPDAIELPDDTGTQNEPDLVFEEGDLEPESGEQSAGQDDPNEEDTQAGGTDTEENDDGDTAEESQQASEQTASATSTSRNRATPTRTTTRSTTGARRSRTADTAKESSGYLVINTIPWARVFVDGKDTRKNTPVQRLRVKAGKRRIGLQTSDGQMHNFSVDVGSGETVRLTKRL